MALLKLIYTVPASKKAAEVAWLKEQKIFPATEDFLRWPDGYTEPTYFTHIGVVVSDDAALAIKLRHNLDLQAGYKQRQR
jgi:hypothetical protein